MRFWLTEVILVGMGYALYAWIRDREGATNKVAHARALRDGEAVISVERALHLDWEHPVQHVMLAFPGAVRALDSFWAYGYLVVTVGAIVIMGARHRGEYRPLRTAFALATAMALAVFALFPTVPPRLLPRRYGIVNTWSTLGGIAARTPPRIERISDPFASLPSLHVAWAVWCGWAILVAWRTSRWRFAWVMRVAGIVYPLLTVLSVVATGNHYVIDCLAGGFLMIVALLTMSVWRPGPMPIEIEVPDTLSTALLLTESVRSAPASARTGPRRDRPLTPKWLPSS